MKGHSGSGCKRFESTPQSTQAPESTVNIWQNQILTTLGLYVPAIANSQNYYCPEHLGVLKYHLSLVPFLHRMM